MAGIIAEREYEAHYYEIDIEQSVLPTAIINYFQDIAIYQSESVGVGIQFLEENQLGWALYQWDISIKEYPKFRQKLKILTNAHSFEKYNAYREFKVFDENNNLIISAMSRWVLLDTKRMRLKKIPEFMYQNYGINMNETEIPTMKKPDELSSIDYEKSFNIRYSDIDTNKHVNNVKYVEWIIETIPLKIVLEYTLGNIRTLYKKEAKYGDSVKVRTELRENGNQVIGKHQVVGERDEVLTFIETLWEKK